MPGSLLRGSHTTREQAAAAFAVVALASAAFYLAVGTPSVTGLAVAATSNQSNVTLSVASTTSVTLEPGLYNFSEVSVGSTNFSSDNPALNLIIANEGSNNITNVYAHTDTLQSEQDNPLGTGVASEHASGKFLWIKNDTSSMYHAGFLSWNITASAGGKPTGMTTGFDNPSTNSWGYYRNASGNHLWALNASTATGNAYCNGTETVLRMKTSADSGTNRDLGDGGTVVDYQPAGGNINENWGVATSGTNEPLDAGPLEGHYAAIHESCEKFYVFRFDADDTFELTDTNHQFLVNDKITPGEEFAGRVGASLPGGIPAGQTNRTLLTIFASSTG